jgi:hypothetical protein
MSANLLITFFVCRPRVVAPLSLRISSSLPTAWQRQYVANIMAENSNNLKQRRGKKSSTPDATASATPEVDEKKSATPLEQLRSAQERLIISRDRTADLHAAWRGQLFRLSLLVVFVAMYQLQTSVSACLREIKDHSSKTAATVTGAEAMTLIFGDSFSELLGFIIASLLAIFLVIGSTDAAQADLDTSWPYMLSCALTPLCIGFFFNSKPMGCLKEEEIENTTDAADDKRHQFPAVVIFHTIVTIAGWFMKSALQQCEDNVKLCTQSIEDFERINSTKRTKLTSGAKRNDIR